MDRKGISSGDGDGRDGLPPETLESVERMTRDLRAAGKTLSPGEVRYLVDAYYIMQRNRIRSEHQARALDKAGEPNETLKWFDAQAKRLEGQIQRVLDVYSEYHPVGEWARSQKGVGPVIASGLLAHIDIKRCPTAGHIWAFAGLDPTKKWEKGTKRPWNAALKTLCWKLGESFVKVSGKDDAFYARIWRERKALEWERNLAGNFVEQAQAALVAKRFGEDTAARAWYEGRFSPSFIRDTYIGPGEPIPMGLKGTSVGDEIAMLPPARIHLRAQRYAVKLFLAHLHDVWYRHEFKAPPPKPYVISHLGHAHYIAPPGMGPKE